MKKFTAILMAALCLLSFSGCQSATAKTGSTAEASETASDVTEETIETDKVEKLSVVTTIFPQYDFTRAVAGENVELTMLLSPGSESHSYEPSPSDIIKIQECDVFIYVGGESDTWVDGILDSMDTSGMKIISMIDLVDAVEEEIVEGMQDDEEHVHDHDDGDEHEEGEDHDHEEEVELDEHVWTSPVNAIAITQHIADTLSALDSANADAYKANAADYVVKLQELDLQFREVAENGSRNTLVFADRFPFRYFADEYGLSYYAAFPGCSTETEASASTVAFLIDKVNEEEIPIVFYIEFSNEKMADTICESTNATKLLMHSCHNISKDDFESGVTYIELMTQNVSALKEALQ